MPLYEYRCRACGQVFEVIQKFSDEPLTSHQSCGGAVERLISASAFQFKGSGWYATDYARPGGVKNGGAEATAESKGESKSESKGESKTESKTEAKTESKPAESAKPAAKSDSK